MNYRNFMLVGLMLLVGSGTVFGAIGEAAIIADHNSVREFDQIPDYWLGKAREMTVHYGHTSHGSQIIAGLNYFRDYVDSVKYHARIRSRSEGVGLPAGEDALRMWEQGSWPYDYWSTPEGMNATRDTLNSGLFNVSGWAWCGEVSGCAPHLNCVDDQFIYDYFNAMNQLEQEYPGVKFFYMTGHAVEQGAVGNNDIDLLRRNGIIRDYARDNNKILFDFVPEPA